VSGSPANDKTASEVALLAVDDSGAFQRIAHIDSIANDSGFREIRFGDVNGDVSKDAFDGILPGSYVASGRNSGFTLMRANGCGFPTLVPSQTLDLLSDDARLVILRVADLNHDGFDDAAILHREQRHLILFFGTGTQGLARGPQIDVPAGTTGELGLRLEIQGADRTAVAATTDPANNKVLVYRIRPRQPPM
jgi:hypothetical protein